MSIAYGSPPASARGVTETASAFCCWITSVSSGKCEHRPCLVRRECTTDLPPDSRAEDGIRTRDPHLGKVTVEGVQQANQAVTWTFTLRKYPSFCTVLTL